MVGGANIVPCRAASPTANADIGYGGAGADAARFWAAGVASGARRRRRPSATASADADGRSPGLAVCILGGDTRRTPAARVVGLPTSVVAIGSARLPWILLVDVIVGAAVNTHPSLAYPAPAAAAAATGPRDWQPGDAEGRLQAGAALSGLGWLWPAVKIFMTRTAAARRYTRIHPGSAREGLPGQSRSRQGVASGTLVFSLRFLSALLQWIYFRPCRTEIACRR